MGRYNQATMKDASGKVSERTNSKILHILAKDDEAVRIINKRAAKIKPKLVEEPSSIVQKTESSIQTEDTSQPNLVSVSTNTDISIPPTDDIDTEMKAVLDLLMRLKSQRKLLKVMTPEYYRWNQALCGMIQEVQNAITPQPETMDQSESEESGSCSESHHDEDSILMDRSEAPQDEEEIKIYS